MKYLYRIVNALLAAAVFPSILFLDGILLRASTSLFDYGLQESFTFMRLINILTGKETFFGIPYEPGTMSWPAALDPAKGKLIACIVFFVLTVVAALFVFFWSIFSNKRIPVAAVSAFGIISMSISTGCFRAATNLLTSGAINVVQLFSDGWLASILGGIINIDRLEFAGFQNGVIICFLLILVWTGSYFLIELGDAKEEKVKKHK